MRASRSRCRHISVVPPHPRSRAARLAPPPISPSINHKFTPKYVGLVPQWHGHWGRQPCGCMCRASIEIEARVHMEFCVWVQRRPGGPAHGGDVGPSGRSACDLSGLRTVRVWVQWQQGGFKPAVSSSQLARQAGRASSITGRGMALAAVSGCASARGRHNHADGRQRRRGSAGRGQR